MGEARVGRRFPGSDYIYVGRSVVSVGISDAIIVAIGVAISVSIGVSMIILKNRTDALQVQVMQVYFHKT